MSNFSGSDLILYYAIKNAKLLIYHSDIVFYDEMKICLLVFAKFSENSTNVFSYCESEITHSKGDRKL